MRNLTIVWRHYAKAGETCERCATTGSSIKDIVAELAKKLESQDIGLSFIETILPEELMAQSNMVLFNGVPLEDVLDNATAAENECPSCSCLTGTDTACRTVEYEGISYDSIPEELIRQAVYAALQTALTGTSKECQC